MEELCIFYFFYLVLGAKSFKPKTKKAGQMAPRVNVSLFSCLS